MAGAGGNHASVRPCRPTVRLGPTVWPSLPLARCLAPLPQCCYVMAATDCLLFCRTPCTKNVHAAALPHCCYHKKAYFVRRHRRPPLSAGAASASWWSSCSASSASSAPTWRDRRSCCGSGRPCGWCTSCRWARGQGPGGAVVAAVQRGTRGTAWRGHGDGTGGPVSWLWLVWSLLLVPDVMRAGPVAPPVRRVVQHGGGGRPQAQDQRGPAAEVGGGGLSGWGQRRRASR